MKTALTLTLTASLIATSLPAGAQGLYMPQPRQTPPPRYMQPPTAYSSDWTRVRAIAPGSRIRVAAVGLGDQDHQYFVTASDGTLTLLLLGKEGLPRAAKRVAVKASARHPELFLSPEKWVEVSDGKARVTPDGLFVDGRKVADLSEIVKTIDAGEVEEVAREVKLRRPSPHDFDPPPPAFVPVFAGGIYGLMALCQNKCGNGVGLAVLLGIPAVFAVIAGRKSHFETQVVYRAR